MRKTIAVLLTLLIIYGIGIAGIGAVKADEFSEDITVIGNEEGPGFFGPPYKFVIRLERENGQFTVHPGDKVRIKAIVIGKYEGNSDMSEPIEEAVGVIDLSLVDPGGIIWTEGDGETPPGWPPNIPWVRIFELRIPDDARFGRHMAAANALTLIDETGEFITLTKSFLPYMVVPREGVR